MRTSRADGKRVDTQNAPIVWFFILERALRDGDFGRAHEAQQQLRRLGVSVQIDGKRFWREAVEA